ncbi:MAG: MarR family transcriptional regulator [Gemmatimonadota bacterium]
MTKRLQEELKQTRPFGSDEEVAYLLLVKAAHELSAEFEALFGRDGITFQQYNVLRILRGAPTEGLPVREIADRLITKDPDVTRLVDRLEQRGLAERQRSVSDRRVVRVRITGPGGKLVDGLDESVNELHRAQLKHLTPVQLQNLIGLLGEVRSTRSNP